MGKSKELSPDLRKRIVDLHKSGMSLGAISKQLYIPRSSVQTTIRKYKLIGGVDTLPRSGRRPKLSPSAEKKLVEMVKNNPGTTTAQACHELKTAGTAVSLTTVRRVLQCYGLKGSRPKKKSLLKNRCRQAQIKVSPDKMDKEKTSE